MYCQFLLITLSSFAITVQSMNTTHIKEELIDLHATNALGESPLLISAREGDPIKLFVYSLMAPKTINKADIFGKTPLMQTATHNYHELAKILLERNAKPDMQDSNGNTALHIAALYGHLEVVKHLVMYQANLNIQNNIGDTAIIIAARHFHFNVMLFLRNAGANLYLINYEKESLDSCLKDQFSSEEEYKSVVFGGKDVVYTTKEYLSESKEFSHDQSDQGHSGSSGSHPL